MKGSKEEMRKCLALVDQNVMQIDRGENQAQRIRLGQNGKDYQEHNRERRARVLGTTKKIWT